MVWVLYIMGLGAAGDGVSVIATVNPPEIPFHRQSAYRLLVDAPAGADIRLPSLDAGFFGMPIDGEADVTEFAPESGGRRMTVTYMLDPVHVQEYAIPPATVHIDGTPHASNAVALRVRELTPEEEQAAMAFAPIEQPRDMDTFPWWVFYAAGGVLIALLAAVVAYILYRGRGSRETLVATPWDRALDQLARLQAAMDDGSIAVDPFYVELSGVVRMYLEDRFALRAPERTTPELLLEAAHTGVLSDVQRDTLERVLRQSDRVKFARYKVSSEEMRDHIGDVRRLIEDTIPVQAEAEPGTEAA